MNSTERYNTDLQRILQMLNGIQPYDKDIDLKKRGKRLVGKECPPYQKIIGQPWIQFACKPDRNELGKGVSYGLSNQSAFSTFAIVGI